MKLIKLPEVLSLTACKRSTHYGHIRDGLMTPPVHLGKFSVAWPEHEITAINAARVAGKSDDEIRQCVATLMADRKNADTRGATS